MNSTKRSKNPDLAKKMTPELRKEVVRLTGFGVRYVNQVLNVNDKRYNQELIDACEQIVAEREAWRSKVSIQIKRIK
jgi:hypothetical protein